MPPLRTNRGGACSLDEGRGVTDDMVGRQDHHHGLRVAAGGMEGGYRNGRGGIATLRLEHDVGLDLGLQKLFRHDEAGFTAGDDRRPREGGSVGDPTGRVLEGRTVRVHEQSELLRHALAGSRPEARTGASAEDDRMDEREKS